MRLKGKTAIVTGAALGLGEATARLFADEGAKVVALDINEASVQAVADDISARGGTAVARRCDVTVEEDVAAVVAATCNQFGSIDILVNNAGVNARFDTTPSTLPLEEWDTVYNVNARGPFLLCRNVIPVMQAGGGGSIVNVSSVGAIFGSGGGHAYRSSKAALLSLTRTLAMEFASDNIRVNSLCPGAMDTPMRHVAAKERAVTTPGSVPLGRIAEPAEIARCILFLASEDSSYVTGATLIADGGRAVV